MSRRSCGSASPTRPSTSRHSTGPRPGRAGSGGRAAKPGRRKVVLATSIAETSLTIEGVHVIDPGLARARLRAEYRPHAVGDRAVSRAAADQRRGRAGEPSPASAIVCGKRRPRARSRPMPGPRSCPPISRRFPRLRRLGRCRPDGTGLPRPPAGPALKEARALLQQLHALDEAGRITETGRRLRNLPLPPRLARMVLVAGEAGQARDAADLAAVLVERGLGGDTTDWWSASSASAATARRGPRTCGAWQRVGLERAGRRPGRARACLPVPC